MDTKGGNSSDKSVSELTWEVNVPDSEIIKKRKGEFPVPKKQKRRLPEKTTESDSQSFLIEKFDTVSITSKPYHSESESDDNQHPVKSAKKCSPKTKPKSDIQRQQNRFNANSTDMVRSFQKSAKTCTSTKVYVGNDGQKKQMSKRMKRLSQKKSSPGKDHDTGGDMGKTTSRHDSDSDDTDDIIAYRKKNLPGLASSVSTSSIEFYSKENFTKTKLIDEYYGGIDDSSSVRQGYVSDDDSDCDVFDSIAKGKVNKLLSKKKPSISPASSLLTRDTELGGDKSPCRKVNKPLTQHDGKERTGQLKTPKKAGTETVPKVVDSSSDSSDGKQQSVKYASSDDSSSDEGVEETHVVGSDITSKHLAVSEQESSSSDNSSSGSEDSESAPNVDVLKLPKAPTVEVVQNSTTLKKKKTTSNTEKSGNKKADKHHLSNQQRLESLRQRQEEAKSKQSAIKQALSSMVGKFITSHMYTIVI